MSLECDTNSSDIKCDVARYVSSLEVNLQKRLDEPKDTTHFRNVIKLIKNYEIFKNLIAQASKKISPELKDEYLIRDKNLNSHIEVLRNEVKGYLPLFEVASENENYVAEAKASPSSTNSEYDSESEALSSYNTASDEMLSKNEASSSRNGPSDEVLSENETLSSHSPPPSSDEEFFENDVHSPRNASSSHGIPSDPEDADDESIFSYDSQEFTQGDTEHDIITTHSKIQDSLTERLAELSKILSQNSILLSKDIEGDAKIVQKAGDSIIGNFMKMGMEGKRIDKLNERLNKTTFGTLSVFIFILFTFCITFLVIRIT